jgi:transcriptional regulator with XRE-family HTH domain
MATPIVRSSPTGIPKTLLHRQAVAFRRVALALGRRVRILRLKREWTVEQSAEHFGIEPAHIRRIEAGRTNPSLAVLVSIARALGVPLADLVSEKSKSRSPLE